MDDLLQGLRAVAEPTRLRILGLCAHAELTVSDLTQILGQSQPRVSRHLKLMVEARLLERFREGQWAFYRIAQDGPASKLSNLLVDLLPDGDEAHARDLERLEAVKRQRAEVADAYFRKNARQWDELRKLYVDDTEVEAALRRLVPQDEVGRLLDIGTGTGRMLEVFADRYKRAVGIDRSREMLAVARANLERSGLRDCQIRQGDMYALPTPGESFDTITVHMVLHYADDPVGALAEAARALRPGGRLIVVDFAPHHEEYLREQHAHRRLGFADDELERWFRAVGLVPGEPVRLPGRSLTVCLWSGRRPANDAANDTTSDTSRITARAGSA
ncbi:ArsR/SmtB family transcription factor [Rhodovibrio salinarum]|uniref:ArsR family transcriptional regulator n=1 Tax=Rhodovibrio salinarum TaxID=1087 RepID=A0A934V0K7_9PROT|nr:metalloregulator ArsR/SmtB family transcription factor [Rhodovibrio salinarum]MBK1697555.1 ArsR family transcriptional regulator [Rhodovibrio salinarum]